MKKLLLSAFLALTVSARADQYFNETVAATKVSVKSTPGNILGVNVVSTNAAPVFLHFYDANVADVTVGTTAQACSPIAVPGSATGGVVIIPVSADPFIKFTKAITIAATTTPTSAGTAPPATPIIVTLVVK